MLLDTLKYGRLAKATTYLIFVITYPFSRERVGKQYVELLTGFRSVTKRQQFSERWFINSNHGEIVTPEKRLFHKGGEGGGGGGTTTKNECFSDTYSQLKLELVRLNVPPPPNVHKMDCFSFFFAGCYHAVLLLIHPKRSALLRWDFRVDVTNRGTQPQRVPNMMECFAWDSLPSPHFCWKSQQDRELSTHEVERMRRCSVGKQPDVSQFGSAVSCLAGNKDYNLSSLQVSRLIQVFVVVFVFPVAQS